MPINLPNGANVEEIVLPNGSNASEVIGPDGSTVWERNAIPDTGLDHYFHGPNIEDISDDWGDEEGTAPLSPNGNPTLSDINGNRSVQYDEGTQGGHKADVFDFGNNKEYTFALAFRLNDTDTQALLTNGTFETNEGIFFSVNSGEWRMDNIGGGGVTGGEPLSDTDYIAVGAYDGSKSYLDINDSEVINESVGNPNDPTSESEFMLADISGGSEYTGDPNIVGAGFSSAFSDSASRSDITSKMADAYGISL